MSLVVTSNIEGMNSQRNLSIADRQLTTSLERLSSGSRINRAADDASSLAISEGLRTQIGGLKVALRNTQDGISVLQTAEGALTETQGVLHRMRDLAVQAANTGAWPTRRRPTSSPRSASSRPSSTGSPTPRRSAGGSSWTAATGPSSRWARTPGRR